MFGLVSMFFLKKLKGKTEIQNLPTGFSETQAGGGVIVFFLPETLRTIFQVEQICCRFVALSTD